MRPKCLTNECFNRTRNEDGICDECNDKKEEEKIKEKERKKRYSITVVLPDGNATIYEECTGYSHDPYKRSASVQFVYKNELHHVVVGGGMIQTREYYKE